MASVTNFSELAAVLETRIEKSLEADVYPVIRTALQKNIQTTVYSYVPLMYQRRKGNGGLANESNIKMELTNKTVLQVRNTAVPNKSLSRPPTPYSPAYDTQFAAWIERGQVRNIFSGADAPWLHPRPFTQNTILSLQTGKEHVTALKKGLKRQHLKIE